MLFDNGTLRLSIINGSNVELIVRNPTLKSNGTTTFDSLFAWYPLQFRFDGESVVVNGYTEFKISTSDENVILLDQKG